MNSRQVQYGCDDDCHDKKHTAGDRGVMDGDSCEQDAEKRESTEEAWLS